MWQERDSTSAAVTGKLQFTGVPFVVVAHRKLECFYGKARTTGHPGMQQSVCIKDCNRD